MGIFNFLKKTKPREVEKETIKLKEFPSWISKKSESLDKSKQEILQAIKEKIEKLVIELNSEIIDINNIDLENKKLELRIKSMAKGNLENYILYLEKLIEKLKNIDKLDNIIENINSIINEFEEKSNITYQKITYISGKEVKATKNSIKQFLIDVEEILKSNKKCLEEFKLIKKLEESSINLKEITKETTETNKEINENKIIQEKLKKELEDKKTDLEKFKNSKEYLEHKKKTQELKSLKESWTKEIGKLNTQIDFKSLSAFYHKFEKEMSLVKKYRENVKEAINQFGLTKLNNFLTESKLNNEEITKTINSIKRIEKQINEFRIKDLSLDSHQNEIKVKESEIETSEFEINTKNKKLNVLEKSSKDTKNKITKELEKFNVILK